MRYSDKKVEIDIHGMTVEEAKLRLTIELSRVGYDVGEITVIHGYHGGRALMNFVRWEFKHPRLRRVRYTDNYGESVLVLNPY